MKNERDGGMRLIRRATVIAVLFLMFLLPVHAQEAFVIDNLHISMKVSEDGGIDITETYQLDFSEYRHGFYRNIPTSYTMEWLVDNELEEKEYYFPVSDVSCNIQCSLEGNKNAVVVKLGDPDKEVIGKNTYEISYHVKTKDLDLSNQAQALYWNLVSNFDTQVLHLSYDITMPKAFDVNGIYTTSGAFGETSSNLTYQVDGLTISGETETMLQANESATIKVNLPNGYFTYPKQKDYSIPVTIISIILVIVSLALFYKFGRDDEVIPTVEFHAPDGLDSASIGYVVDSMVENKDVISLIIEWANKGFIKIYDLESGFQLEKLKDMTEDNSQGYEREFFQAIFMNKTKVSEEDLKCTRVQNSLAKTKTMIKQSFDKPEKRIYTRSSIILQIVMIIFIWLPGFLLTLLTTLAKYETLRYSILELLVPFILLISVIPWILIMRKRYVLKKSSLMLSVCLMLILNGLFIALNAFVQINLGANLWCVILVTFSTILMIVLMMFMDKRSEQGNRWLGQILGLKDFIMTAEKDRLELLVKDDPQAFYSILPYAYVLGVSDTWVKKFESITIPSPTWYQGNTGDVFTTMLWWNHFHYCFNDIQTAVTYIPEPKGGSGGGSFGSGGFSGGGFSGGGFGGGGGGSW